MNGTDLIYVKSKINCNNQPTGGGGLSRVAESSN